MSDSSQTWCMVPTEPASDCATQAPTAVYESNAETMTALTTLAIEEGKDETYYWHTVKFSVQGISFKVPRYQFVIGSTYFAQKLGSTKLDDNEGDEVSITLGEATVSQFRVFLKLLFPIHTTSTTLKFSKEEWLVILELSTLWDFHEFRKLAKDHLDPLLDNPIERITVGRAAYIPRWVLEGYETLVTRPECINEQESERIGHLTTVRLYILRHERCFDPKYFASRFGEEIHALEQRERDHMSVEEKRIEEEKRLQEERQRRDREEERRLEEERVRAEREEEERKEREEMERRERAEQERLAAEEKKRQEEELQRRAEEARMEQERIAEEARKKAEEERVKQQRAAEERMREEEEERRQQEEERLQKEADEFNRKKEELHLEADRIARELADLKRKEEARLQEERDREGREQRAREREGHKRTQKAERERLPQQFSKPPSLGGFESTWGGKLTLQPLPGISPERSFQWGNAGAPTTSSAFEFAAPGANNAVASLFGGAHVNFQDIGVPESDNTGVVPELRSLEVLGEPEAAAAGGSAFDDAWDWDVKVTGSGKKKKGKKAKRLLDCAVSAEDLGAAQEAATAENALVEQPVA